MIKHSGQLTRATLDGMIRERIVEQAADEDAGVGRLAAARSQRVRGELESAGGRRQAAGGGRCCGSRPSRPARSTTGSVCSCRSRRSPRPRASTPRPRRGTSSSPRELAKTSKSMKIDVNPRYGRWDAGRSTLPGAKIPVAARPVRRARRTASSRRRSSSSRAVPERVGRRQDALVRTVPHSPEGRPEQQQSHQPQRPVSPAGPASSC